MIGRFSGLAALLGVLSCSGDATPSEGSALDFDALPQTYARTEALGSYPARDGAALPLRSFDADSPVALILLHGSSADGLYLQDLASRVADAGAARVYVPDLRGHGRAPERRGDIEYENQLEDDVADLIARTRRDGATTVVLGGHSSGGGLAVRVAGSDIPDRPEAVLLLAPYLNHDAPTVRPNSGGWARPRTARIIAVSILEGFGIRAFGGVTTLDFAIPDGRTTGRETRSYSYRLMMGFAPRDYRSDLVRLCEPALVLVGSEDQAFHAERFAPLFEEFAPQARVALIPGAGHLGLVIDPRVGDEIVTWLRALSEGGTDTRCVEDTTRD